MKRTTRRAALWSLWGLCLLALCPSPAHAYLDPGTGSMLVSALAGIAATLFFMLKSFYYKAAGLFFRLLGVSLPAREEGGVIFYSEGAQYWTTFKPVLEALDRMGKKALYLTSGANDPGLSHPFTHIAARHIGEGGRAFALLNMLEADLCVMTTPGLDVLQIRRSPGVKRYAYLSHSVTDMAIYKIYSFDWFDAVLCAGAHQMKSLRALETLRGTPKKELLPTGCPYMDVLADAVERTAEEAHNAPVENGPRILIAPTWGRNGLLAMFGEKLLLPLAEKGFSITVRPHPQSFVSEAALMESLQKATAPFKNVEWDRSPNGFEAMRRSDVLVSDLSGIVFDYAFVFERPVVTVRFTPDLRGMDGADLPHPIWELEILESLGAQVSPEDIGDLPRVIDSLPKREEFIARIRSLREESIYNYRTTGEAAARQLVELAEKAGAE